MEVVRLRTWHNGRMRFRTGLITGLSVGYVLGARAGRERYDQLVAWWEQIRGDDHVAAALTKVADATAGPRNRARDAVGESLRSAGSAIRERTDQG